MEELVLKKKEVEVSGASFSDVWETGKSQGHSGEGCDDSIRVTIGSEGGVIEKVRIVYTFPFSKEDKLFLNGYQSWTHSRELGTRDYDRSMRFCPKPLDWKFGFSAYGDGTFYQKSYRKGRMHGYTYAYIRRGSCYYFFGSLAEHTGFTRIIFDTNVNTITFEKDCAGRKVHGNYRALDLWFGIGTEKEVFDGWFAAMGVQALTQKRLTGYTSWYNYYQNINEKVLLRDASGMAGLSIKPDLFQIDDGYECAVGDWLRVDKTKFPRGMKPVVTQIREMGMQAGIWMAPFVCEKNSVVYREHPEWLLRDRKGQTVYGGCNWGGMYALDSYKEEVQDYVRKCIDEYKEMGFTLFKLDFLYAVCMLPRKDKTRGEIMEEAMTFLRDCCGDCMIIGCGVPLASAFGKVEYCRIGMDMSLSWDDALYMRPLHSERPSTKHTMQNTYYRRQLSGRAFLNDPDVFLLRDYNCRLTKKQKIALAKVNCRYGSVLFTSDNPAEYNEEQRKVYEKLIRVFR